MYVHTNICSSTKQSGYTVTYSWWFSVIPRRVIPLRSRVRSETRPATGAAEGAGLSRWASPLVAALFLINWWRDTERTAHTVTVADMTCVAVCTDGSVLDRDLDRPVEVVCYLSLTSDSCGQAVKSAAASREDALTRKHQALCTVWRWSCTNISLR